MEQMTMAEEARNVAQIIASPDTHIDLKSVQPDRISFEYEGGCVQSHRLPKGWDIVGFGSQWFALMKSE